MKKLPIILGMTLLFSWNTLAAQASPQDHRPGHAPVMQIRMIRDLHAAYFRPTLKDYEELLELLDMKHWEFQREIDRGRSLAEIAKRQDVSEKKVIKLIEKQMKEHVKRAEKQGHISKEQANRMNKRAKDDAERLVKDRYKTKLCYNNIKYFGRYR